MGDVEGVVLLLYDWYSTSELDEEEQSVVVYQHYVSWHSDVVVFLAYRVALLYPSLLLDELLMA